MNNYDIINKKSPKWGATTLDQKEKPILVVNTGLADQKKKPILVVNTGTKPAPVVPEDENVLQDGKRMHVPLMLKDSDIPPASGVRIMLHDNHPQGMGTGYSPATAARQRLADQERYRAIAAGYRRIIGGPAQGPGQGISDSQAAYTARVNDAWKAPDQLPEPRRPHADAAATGSQAAYEARLRNAWKG